jgi:hypothetical protein
MGFDPQDFFISLMDFFSILLPGALLTWLLMAEVGPIVLRDRYAKLAGAQAWAAFLFASYLFGHLVFLLGPPRRLTASPRLTRRDRSMTIDGVLDGDRDADPDRGTPFIQTTASYVPGGSVHCAGIYPFFQERTVNGTALVDWTAQLATGASLPPRVVCEGAECCDDPVCDECAATPEAERPGYCGFCARWPSDWPECGGT